MVTRPAALPTVAIFSLGGTIAATNVGADHNGGVTPHLDGDDLVAAVPQLRLVAVVQATTFRQVPSGDLNLSDLTELAEAIQQRFDEGADGIVVTQGTDTMEETAFALDLLVNADRPIVVTGAMRNPTLAGADGPANLLAAVQVAASSDAAGLGTLVVANDEIHAARFVRKAHSSSPGAFQSPGAGPLGWVVEGRVRIVFRVAKLQGIPSGAPDTIPPVALLTSVLGDDARLLTTLEHLGYAGLVLEGFGGGHVPRVVVPVLSDLAARLPVVLASRTGGGETLRDTYGQAGAERDLLGRGLISAGFLNGPKARILLTLLLAHELDLDGVRGAFERVNASVASF